MESIISESFSSVRCFLIADRSKLYLVNRCMGRTRMSANLNLWNNYVLKCGCFYVNFFNNSPITLLLCLAPCQIRGEQCVVAIQLFTVILACALLGAKSRVWRKYGSEPNKALLKVIHTHGMSRLNAVFYLSKYHKLFY